MAPSIVSLLCDTNSCVPLSHQDPPALIITPSLPGTSYNLHFFYLLTLQSDLTSVFFLDAYHVWAAITVHAEGSRKEQRARTESNAGVD